MKLICRLAAQSYELKLMEAMIKTAYGSHDIQGSTINSTGPGLIQRVLSAAIRRGNQYFIEIEGSEITIGALRRSSGSFIEPIRNTRSWLGIPIINWIDLHPNKVQAQKMALSMVIESIMYEMQHFKIIRLDDHIKQLATCLNCQSSVAANMLCKQLMHLRLHYINIKVAQLSFEHQETRKFYELHNLLGRCYSLPTPDNEHFMHVLNEMTSRSLCQLICLSGLERLAETSNNELKQLAQWLNRGLDFIESMVDNFPPNGNSYALNDCQSIMESEYSSVISVLNNLLREEDQIEVAKFRRIHSKVNTKCEAIFDESDQFSLHPRSGSSSSSSSEDSPRGSLKPGGKV